MKESIAYRGTQLVVAAEEETGRVVKQFHVQDGTHGSLRDTWTEVSVFKIILLTGVLKGLRHHLKYKLI